jgi:SAM-dependent methyltransferase
MKSNAFDAFASEYDARLDDPWRRRFADGGDFFIDQKCRAMLREVGDAGRPLALDVGCGQGRAVAFLSDRWRTVGTDVSREMLRRAAAGLRLAVQEPFALPFGDGTFDVVFAFCVYHHLDRADHARHLRELVRVARRGGRVFVFEHNPFNPVTQIVFRRAPIDRGCRMIAPAQLRRTCAAAGLDSLDTGYVLFAPEALARRAARLEAALRWLPLGGQYFVSGIKPR